jgi:prophage tail gpP-like protein
VPSDIALKIGGDSFGGWTSLRVERSLDSIAAPFQFNYIDTWGQNNDKWYIYPQADVQITIDKDTILTGYIDAVTSEVSGSSHSYSVAGRDKTADLVDCAVTTDQNAKFKKQSLVSLIKRVIKPYGINLVNQSGINEQVSVANLQPGQTAFQFIESLVRQNAILVTTDEMGGLVLTKPGFYSSSVKLVEGENILSARCTLDYSNRFSQYFFYGQGVGSAFFFGNSSSKLRAKASDLSVKRFRPKVALSENNTSPGQIVKRAQWEAAFNAARGLSVQVRVVGWRQGPESSDPLWRSNMKIHMVCPSIGIDGDLLIERVTYSLDPSGGQTTELVLTKEDAWIPNPSVPNDINSTIEVPL